MPSSPGEANSIKCPYCLSENPPKAKKCQYCGKLIDKVEPLSNSISESSASLMEGKTTKPVYARMLAWIGCAINAVFLMYTIFNFAMYYPENTGLHILIAIITIAVFTIYFKGAQKLHLGVFELSTILAWLWLGGAMIIFAMIKSHGISTKPAIALVTGSIVWLIMHIVALRQVKKYHKSIVLQYGETVDSKIRFSNTLFGQFLEQNHIVLSCFVLLMMVVLLVLLEISLFIALPVGILMAILFYFLFGIIVK